MTGFGFGYVTGGCGSDGSGGCGILRIPAGVSVARQFMSEDGKWALVPYLSPRVALDIGISGPDTEVVVRKGYVGESDGRMQRSAVAQRTTSPLTGGSCNVGR